MFRIAFHPDYILDLPKGHRFPMEKYELLPQQLLLEGTVEESQFFAPGPCPDQWLKHCHEPNYLNKLRSLSLNPKEVRKSGFPQSRALMDREWMIMEGSRKGVDYALKDGIAFNIAGGTHHAGPSRAEGFCLLNDLAIAACYGIHGLDMKQVLIIDLDVHQGDGTAEIFKNEKRVYTFSMHGKNNFPLKKQQSDWDLALEDGTGDELYLNLLSDALEKLFNTVQPELICFQSGVDVLGTDKLGRMNLSLEGCKTRDRMVLENAKQRNIPLIAAMGGGYSPHIKDIIEAHANTYRLAAEIYS